MNFRYLALAVSLTTLPIYGHADNAEFRRHDADQMIKEALAEKPAPKACLPPNLLPTSPSGNAQVAAPFTAIRSNGEQLSAQLWRESCDASTSYVYLRITPRAGPPFVCGSHFTVLASSAQYDVRLTPQYNTSSFCGDLFVPTTFLVDQWSFNAKYDNSGALTLLHTWTGFPSVVSQTWLPARPVGAPPITPLNVENGLWWSPAEGGTGYTVAVRNGTLVMVIYSFKSDGEPQWYLTAGPLTNGNRNYTGMLDRYRGGQCITCTYRGATLSGNDGAISIVFNSAGSATLSLPGGRVTTIQPMQF